MDQREFEAASSSSKISVRMLVYIAIGWGLVVAAALTWQAYTYRGVFAAMAEWQFREWDRMFPVATIGLTTLLLELPLLLIIYLRLRERRRQRGPIRLKTIVERERLGARILAILSGFALIIAVALVFQGLTVSGVVQKPAGLSSLESVSSSSADLVRTRGFVRMDRIGYYRERFLFVGRDLWVAPVTTAQDAREINLFMEVSPTERASEPKLREVSGIVRRAAVPGGLRRLYEYEGYNVSPTAHVIFSSRASAQWPYLSAAADLAIGALLGLLLALALHWHAKRLIRVKNAAVPDQT